MKKHISEHVALRIAMKKILELEKQDLEAFISEVTEIPFVIVNDEFSYCGLSSASDDDEVTNALLK